MLQFSISTLKKKRYSDEEILKGIIDNQNWAISQIYKTQYNAIKKMVYSFRNTKLDPDDVFQEGITRTILNIRAGKFRGESLLATYLISICRNICLKIVANPNPVQHDDNLISENPENDNYYELLTLVNNLKTQLGDGCRVIIDLRFKQSEEVEETGVNNKLNGFDEIAQRLDITTDNARQRFKRCLDQLRKLVFDHPEYRTILD